MTKDLLSHNIIKLRKALGWSQEKLAQEAEVSYHTIFRAESGTKPKMDNLIKISSALGVSVDELLGDLKQKTQPDDRASLILEIQSRINRFDMEQLTHVSDSLDQIESLKSNISSLSKDSLKNK